MAHAAETVCDARTCRAFYVPGMKGMPSWNKVPPKLVILVRIDFSMDEDVESWKEDYRSLEESAFHAANEVNACGSP